MAPLDARPVPQANNVPPGAGKVLSTILIFSILMIVVPLGLYFASWEGYLDRLYALTVGIPTPENRPVASAILAVLGVNVVVGGFIWTAFKEVNPAEPTAAEAKKRD